MPDPDKLSIASADPEFSKTMKLVLALVIFAVATPAPAKSMNTFEFAFEEAGPISSTVKSIEVIEFACAIFIPPSASEAAAVSPSVILSNVNSWLAPMVVVMIAPSTVVPESSSMPVIEVSAEKSRL